MSQEDVFAEEAARYQAELEAQRARFAAEEAEHANDGDPESGPAVAPHAWIAKWAPVPAAWYTTPPTKREWLLRDSRVDDAPGVLPLGKVGMLVAEGGAGKTMALLGLAVAVATGTPWLGCLTVPKAGRVLVIAGEEDDEEVHRRLFNVVRASGQPSPDPDSIVVLPLAGVPCPMLQSDERGNPVDAPFLGWLRAKLQESGPWALVIVDPLSRFAGLDAEVDNAAATRFVQALESIAAETHATVMLAHHSNKLSRGPAGEVSASSSRGSSAIVDGVRWAATLSVEKHKTLKSEERSRLGHTVTLAFQKSNYSMRGEPIELRHDTRNGGALLPLDDTDRETVGAARGAEEPALRRRAEREERTGLQAAEREAQVAAKGERERARRAAEDDAVRSCATNDPGLTEIALVAGMRARLGTCGTDAARTAIARARFAGWLEIRTGPKNGKTHHIVTPKTTP